MYSATVSCPLHSTAVETATGHLDERCLASARGTMQQQTLQERALASAVQHVNGRPHGCSCTVSYTVKLEAGSRCQPTDSPRMPPSAGKQ